MLRIYSEVLVLIRDLQPFIVRIERRDADLARQFRRALASVALNLAEGSLSQGGHRGSRYHSAMASCRESQACLEVAEALSYIDTVPFPLSDRFGKVIATLRKVLGR